jgi:hypothetical protein
MSIQPLILEWIRDFSLQKIKKIITKKKRIADEETAIFLPKGKFC